MRRRTRATTPMPIEKKLEKTTADLLLSGRGFAGQQQKPKEETPEDPHVLEAEGEETILRPDGTHDIIKGPSHAEDGVKLTKSQAPENSFIFSKTRSMTIKDPNVLAHFGVSGPKVPAEIAKKFPLNEYKAIIEDPNKEIMRLAVLEVLKNESLILDFTT